jgi:hypothetical protein
VVVVVGSSLGDAHAASKNAISKTATPNRAVFLATEAKLTSEIRDATAGDSAFIVTNMSRKSFLRAR